MAERLGQHFLNNPDTARRIADLVSPQPGERILEIGPGRGALTEFITGRGASVTGIELDGELCGFLEKRFGSELEVINGDFLDSDLCCLKPDKICGNIPYQITGAVLEKISSSAWLWSKAVLMIPSAVALRAAAPPGTACRSAVSVLCRVSGRCRVEFKVPPAEFDPPPKIESALITIERTAPPVSAELRNLVRDIFKNRRKKIKNALSRSVSVSATDAEALLLDADIDPGLRPQDLTCRQYKNLAEIIVKRGLF